MPLAPGIRLGPHELIDLLGAGGMGEVFRARDTRLGRDVAIKVIGADDTGDPSRRQRFQREARAIAALSHPHICAIHDVGSEAGIDYLVLELVQGQTLASRLRRGPLPLDEALARGIEIAQALDHAHRAGIVHRDLKPGNVMLTLTGAKVLDFGLARITRGDTDTPLAPASNSTASLTEAGGVLGTLPYMAPEQIEGRVADARTDVFAFGTTLYEMVTGTRAFEAASTPGLIGAILRGDTPSLAAAQPNLPPALDHIVRTCLAKDPEARFASLNDVAITLQWARDATREARQMASMSGTAASRRSWWLAIAALAALGAVGTIVWLKPSVPAGTELRLEISTPRTLAPHEFALSPDGRSIVAHIAGGGPSHLWVRQLETGAVRQLESGAFPFWSPDSNSIGYFAGGSLRRVDLIDGKVQRLAAANPGRGGSWNGDGTILFASLDGPIMRIPEAGGEARPATRMEAGQTAHRFPHFLPDNRHFLYYVVGNDDQRGLYLASLDGVGQRIAAADSAAVALSNDRIIFNTQGVIAVHQLDRTRGTLVGEPQTIIESAPINPYLAPEVSVAATGAIAYRSWVDERQLRWFDRAGTPLESVGEPSRDGLRKPRLSPDGKRLAVDRIVLGNRDVWIRDLANGAMTRFTTDRSLDGYPVWSPDGSEIAFLSDRHGSYDIFVKSSNGTGPEKELLRAAGNQWPLDWSRDGRWLLYYDAKNAGDLWAMPVVGEDRTPVPIAQSPFAESDAALSPDGRWVAYPSNDSGRAQIVVQSFPKATAKWQVSVTGGLGPVWSANGKELYFIAPDGKLTVVPVQATSADFKYGTAFALFQPRIVNTSIASNGAEFVVAADGRTLVIEAVDDVPAPITVILNWNGRAR
jgi:Tol biopolymer transport system component